MVWQTIERDVRRLRQRIFTCLLEPDAVKVASPVVRGAGRSNAPGLPDMSADEWTSAAVGKERDRTVMLPLTPPN